jgi:hypothetical protein
MITMLLGGLWHGAGWTFVIWGGLHGFYLVINHGWRAINTRYHLEISHPIAWALTMFSVVVAWVFFRAPGLSTAVTILGVMFGFVPPAESIGLVAQSNVLLIFSLVTIVLAFPNAQELMRDHVYFLGDAQAAMLQWRPNVFWGAATAAMAILSVMFVSRESVFLYFQF